MASAIKPTARRLETSKSAAKDKAAPQKAGSARPAPAASTKKKKQ